MQRGLLGNGVIAGANAFATRAATAAILATQTLAPLSAIAGRISCTFYILSDALAVVSDPNLENVASLAVDAVMCGVTRRPRPKPKQTCPFSPGRNSFSAETMVWIKEGLKQIKDIREGDQVLAWDPVTNAPVLKPVVGVSSRLAVGDIYRLTLADAGGKQSTTVVTGNHPYLLAEGQTDGFQGAGPLVGLEGAKPFHARSALVAANDNGPVAGTILRIAPGGDWKIVKNLRPGDQIRTALNGRVGLGSDGTPRLLTGPGNDLLTVVSVELDQSPRHVYNFEVEGLHSYAVGELGEWVHNGYGAYVIGGLPGGKEYVGKGDIDRARASARRLGGQLKQFFSAKSDCDSFILEDKIIERKGGIEGGGLTNKINSPGRKLRGR